MSHIATDWAWNVPPKVFEPRYLVMLLTLADQADDDGYVPLDLEAIGRQSRSLTFGSLFSLESLECDGYLEYARHPTTGADSVRLRLERQP